MISTVFTEGSGFVYGVMCFVDKVSTGVAIMLIQSVMPDPATDNPDFFRYVLGYGCGGAAIFGWFIMAHLWAVKIGKR